MTPSPNPSPLLFRERLRGFCAGFTFETGAGVCVCHRQPPGLLIAPPSKLRVGEVFVSQFKTLLEPESSSWWLSVNLLLFYYCTWSRLCDAGILTCVRLNLARCRVHYTPWLGNCWRSARSGFLEIAVLPNTGYYSSVPKAWKRAPEAKDTYCHPVFQPFCQMKASFIVMLFSLRNVMVPERTVLNEGRSCRGAFEI